MKFTVTLIALGLASQAIAAADTSDEIYQGVG